jgi:hypothetical protein
LLDIGPAESHKLRQPQWSRAQTGIYEPSDVTSGATEHRGDVIDGQQLSNARQSGMIAAIRGF